MRSYAKLLNVLQTPINFVITYYGYYNVHAVYCFIPLARYTYRKPFTLTEQNNDNDNELESKNKTKTKPKTNRINEEVGSRIRVVQFAICAVVIR